VEVMALFIIEGSSTFSNVSKLFGFEIKLAPPSSYLREKLRYIQEVNFKYRQHRYE
jgi:hypothetical protein